MADLDKETIEAADRAFDEEAKKLDEWESALAAESTPEEPAGEPGEPSPENPGEPSAESTSSTEPPRLPTREEARAMVLADYDTFDDVVEDGKLVPSRLAEYTSGIAYSFKSFTTGETKVKTLPKYPRFLEIFGAESASEITVADVMERFGGEEYEKAIYADRQATKLAMAAGRIIEYSGLEMDRELTEKDYGIMTECGVDSPRKYRTVGEVLGMDGSAFEFAPDSDLKCVYNSEYEDTVSGLFGAPDEDDEPEVVSLDDVMSGVDMKMFDRMTRGRAGDAGGKPVIPFET
jgi:hypothetical protein